MKQTIFAFAVIMAAHAGLMTRAGAERLISSLSAHQVMISSNFTGTEIVLFGSVERDSATVARRGGYDIVVTVSGPNQDVVTRRKERVLGIWANVESRAIDAPGYLAVLSNRPLDAIASPDVRRRFQLGVRYPVFQQPDGNAASAILPDDPFRSAFIRIKTSAGLYSEKPDAVTFLAPTLFRASIVLPADSPLGTYEVDVKLFADGANIGRTTSALEIIKVGFEQFIANASKEHGLLYGLATMLMALTTGWLGAFIFRRD